MSSIVARQSIKTPRTRPFNSNQTSNKTEEKFKRQISEMRKEVQQNQATDINQKERYQLLITQNAMLQSRLDQKSKDLDDLKLEYERLKLSYEHSKRQTGEFEIEVRYNGLLARFEQLNTDYNRLFATLNGPKIKISPSLACNPQLLEAAQIYDGKVEELDVIKTKYQQLKEKLKELKRLSEQQLNLQIQESEQQRRQFILQIDTLSSDLQNLQNKYQHQKEKLTEYRDVKFMNNQYQNQVIMLENQVKQLQYELEFRDRRLERGNEVVTNAKQIKSNYSELQTQYERLSVDYNSVSLELRKMKETTINSKDFEELYNKYAELAGKFKTTHQKYKENKQELDEAKTKLSNAELVVKHLQIVAETSKAEKLKTKEKDNELLGEAKEYLQEYQVLQHQVKLLEQQNQSLKDQIFADQLMARDRPELVGSQKAVK